MAAREISWIILFLKSCFYATPRDGPCVILIICTKFLKCQPEISHTYLCLIFSVPMSEVEKS